MGDLNGFCIGCGDSVDFNLEKPFCPLCFEIMVGFHVHDYDDRFCHSCGHKFSDASLITWNNPKCFNCLGDN